MLLVQYFNYRQNFPLFILLIMLFKVKDIKNKIEWKNKIIDYFDIFYQYVSNYIKFKFKFIIIFKKF